MTDIIPDWLDAFLRDQLESHASVLNVLPIEDGKWKGAFLVNTSRGAALVQHGATQPKMWYLPMPGQHVDIQCKCGQRMTLVDPDLPVDVRCSHCQQGYKLAQGTDEIRVTRKK